MECRTLELKIISAKGLKKATLIGKMDVYAVVSISGASGKPSKLRTPVAQDAGTEPTWNFPMKFTIDERAGLQNRLTLLVEIKHEGTFGDKEIGEANVPIRELLDGIKKEGKGEEEQPFSYQVLTPSGKPKGTLNFSYKFGEKFTVDEPVKACATPTGMVVGSSSGYQQPYYPPPPGYAPPPQPGYAYPPQQPQPGYGYPPPPPVAYGGYPPPQGYPPVEEPKKGSKKNKKNGSGGAGAGLGLGAGLLGGALGGLLIADIISDATDGKKMVAMVVVVVAVAFD